MNVLGWFLVALPLALDVFAVGLVFGLAGLERVRWLSVSLSFAVLDAPLGPMVLIVGGQAFVATFLGLLLGKRLGTRAGDAAEIIAGAVFTVLGLFVLYKAFTSRA